MLNARREEHCTAITTERKYYETDGSFAKRSLRPHEWQHHHAAGISCIPKAGNERLLNEAAALRFIAANKDIPVPKLHAAFQDDEAVYVVTELIDCVTMASLEPGQRKQAALEVEGYVKTLRSLKSDTWGGPNRTGWLTTTYVYHLDMVV